MKNIIKWTGGKTSEIPVILENMPKNFDRYVEPFLGGGALYFHLEHEKSIVNDLNNELMKFYVDINDNFWLIYEDLKDFDDISDAIDELDLNIGHNIFEKNKTICTHPAYIKYFQREIDSKNKLIQKIELKNNKKITDEEYFLFIKTAMHAALYYAYREFYNKAPCADSAYFFIMRELSYSGMFRFCKNGNFNVPYGGISYNKKRMRSKFYNMLDLSERSFYNNTEFNCMDFKRFFSKYNNFTKYDFIFIDPPYDSEFSQYNKEEDFDFNKQIELADLLTITPAKFMAVVKETPNISKLYTGFNIKSFDKKYSVNFKNRNNQDVRHLIITNYW